MVGAVAKADPAPEVPDLRLQVSLRLKAARHLAGSSRPSKGGFEAVALTVEELAKRPLVIENGITKNRLDAYEQMKTEPRPMELQVIADALGVPRDFLLAPLPASAHTPTIEDKLGLIEDTLNLIKDELPRLGRDIGRQDLQLRAAEDRHRRSRQPAAA